MLKRQTLIILSVITVIIIGTAVYMNQRTSDKCTSADRANNNCVPAGRCTPPGDPREAVVDCPLKNYDHKFRE